MNTPTAEPAAHRWERIDSKWAWHHHELLRLRQHLLHAQSCPVPEPAPSAPSDDETRETTAENLEREIILCEVLAKDERLPEVDAALQRIRAGSYGVCEETGQPIPEARLRALPWTRFCRAPAERRFRPV